MAKYQRVIYSEHEWLGCKMYTEENKEQIVEEKLEVLANLCKFHLIRGNPYARCFLFNLAREWIISGIKKKDRENRRERERKRLKENESFIALK